MMNTRNLGLKESVGVKYKDGIFGELYLKLATVKRQSFKQSLSKVSSEGAVRRCSSKFLLFIIISLFKIGCTIALKKKISLIKASDIK